MNVTVFVQTAPYEWLHVAAIGLIAALAFALNTFLKD